MQGAFLNKGAVFFSFSSLLLHQRPQVGPHRGRKCSRGIRRAGQSLPLAQRASAGENPPPSRTPLTVLRTPLVAQTGSADEQRGGALQSVPSLSAGGKTHCNSPSTDRFFSFFPMCFSCAPLALSCQLARPKAFISGLAAAAVAAGALEVGRHIVQVCPLSTITQRTPRTLL